MATAVGGAVVAWVATSVHRKVGSRQLPYIAATILLAVETAFLVAAGAPLWSSSPKALTPTPTVSAFQRAVGSSVVGFGTDSCIASTIYGTPGLGIIPDTNVAFQIHEFAIYDPIAPSSLFTSWRALTGKPGGLPFLEHFCPAVSSVAVARLFGIHYVLEPSNTPGPSGSTFVGSFADEWLYRIPGAAPATLVRAPSPSSLPANSVPGIPISVHHPSPATWALRTDSTTPQVLRLRITDVPGWHATIDGHPQRLQRFSGVMLQVRVPPGHHVIVVDYAPATFTWGLIAAACSASVLVAALLIDNRRRRERRGSAATAA